MIQDIKIDSFPAGPLGCNCSIIWSESSKQAMLIDPGGDAEKIISKIDNHQLKIKKIIHTHAHFDHFLASQQLRDHFQVEVGLHKDDLFLWQNLKMQCSMFNIPYTETKDPDFFIDDENDISISGCSGCAIHTPGHTPGSLSFYYEDADILIAGDTLFREGVGRTDLWGGDTQKLLSSIQNKIFSLPSDTKVITGHGKSTTVGHEKESNPFLRI